MVLQCRYPRVGSFDTIIDVVYYIGVHHGEEDLLTNDLKCLPLPCMEVDPKEFNLFFFLSGCEGGDRSFGTDRVSKQHIR